ncbi:MAG: MotA/TolQ/ExbB proton channel family protein [Thermoguttaceae bacterium]|nr:MotA/TolQ/ExbB proton channel family protein [Thermoguttaceae bacterium]MDW8038277.1 MotA/TolQ/ExbB proton channel family protein [Thermoguttaceae bacterium]
MKKHVQAVMMVVVWALLMVSGHLIFRQVVPEQSWAYRFVYERGPIQWAIVGVAVWTGIMLYGRWRRYCRQGARFRRFLEQQSPPPDALAEVLRRASRFWQEAGPKAVRTYLDRLRSEQHEALDKYYEVVRYVIGTLPFLGLFGTVVGLTMALEQAFSQGPGNGAVEKFVAGLAVALDTTVLGMACAAPLFGCFQWLLARHHALVDQIVEYLRAQFRLEDVPDQDEAVAVLQEELGRITKRIAEEVKTFYAELAKQTKATFSELATESVDSLRTVLEQGVRQHLAEYHQTQQTAMETFTTQTTELFQEGFRQVSQTLSQRLEEILQEHRQLIHQQSEALQAEQQRFHQQQTELLQHHGQTMAERFEQAVGQMGQQLAQAFQPSFSALEQALQRTQEQWSGHLEEAVQTVVAGLRPMVAELIQQTAQNAQQFHSSLTNRLTEHMNRLEQAIHHRTPEEIVIRYRDGKYRKEIDRCHEAILV